MIDKPVLERKVEELERCLSGLEALQRYDISIFKKDMERRWALERGLQVAIQCVIDIGTHILAGSGDTGIEDYAGTIERLGERGVIPKTFAKSIAPMAGFRNILVHEYAEVDINEVYKVLHGRLGDFKKFIGCINRFLSKTEK